jgi:hypothetical protein
MVTVVVERSFEQPVDVDALQSCEERSKWCLEVHDVRFLHSYVSPDRKRMICIYEAPDAESVRKVNDTAGMPFVRVWTASVLEPPKASSTAQ